MHNDTDIHPERRGPKTSAGSIPDKMSVELAEAPSMTSCFLPTSKQQPDLSVLLTAVKTPPPLELQSFLQGVRFGECFSVNMVWAQFGLCPNDDI